MKLALFDLDNTLLDGDSDHLWGEFLVRHGHVDARWYREQNDRFYAQYQAGELDVHEFLRFALKPLADHDRATLESWRNDFLESEIMPRIGVDALQLVDKHRGEGELPMIITATNRFITEPIAQLFGIDHLLATEPEIKAGEYTGEVSGTPCFQEGKLRRLEDWLNGQSARLEEACFYSDSRNDLPLLEAVGRPVAVNPDPTLEAVAQARDWPIMRLSARP